MKKRILFIHHSGSVGGAGVSLLNVIRVLIESGYDVDVCLPSKPSFMIEELNNLNCRIIKISPPMPTYNHYNGGIDSFISIDSLRNIYELWRNKYKLKTVIEQTTCQIVAVNSMTLCWMGIYAKKKGLKTVCFHRETYPEDLLGMQKRYIINSISNGFDRVAFISKYDYNVTGNIKSKKYLIYDRVEIEKYNNLSIEHAKRKLNFKQDFKYVLYLGGFSSLKGGDTAVEAFKYLKNEKYKLIFLNSDFQKNKFDFKAIVKTLLGRRDITKSIHRIIKKHKLESNILFFTTTNTPELFYKACDMVIFPSRKPHQARPIYESGVAKIPILIADFENTKEFAEDGVSAITFEPNNPDSLAKAIKSVASSKELVEEIVKRNYELTIKKHNIQSLGEDLMELFSGL